jgi:multidrug efflux pump subunit AcrA (membrane-fusion protein)
MGPRSLCAVGLVAVLAALGGAAGCTQPSGTPSTTAPAASAASGFDPATRLRVTVGPISSYKPVAGRHTTADEAVARVRTGGTLVRLLVDEGSIVAVGQLIAVVDEPRLSAEVAARSAGAEAASAATGIGASAAEAARAEVARAEAMAAQAPAALEQARAGQARAQADYERTRQLFEQGVYAQARLDQMLAARRVADAQVLAAEAAVTAARQAVGAARAQIGVAEAQTRAARAQADAARAEAGIASAMRAEGRIVAPRGGRVTAVPYPLGSVVMPGEAVAVIAGGAPVLKLMVPEADAAALRPGQLLSLTDEAGAVTGQAAIAKLYPSVTAGQIEVDLAIDGVEEQFVGARTTVLVPVGQRQGIVVPASHVRTRAGADYARLLRGGAVMEVPVQLGTRRPDGVEVLTGLVAGDIIVAWPQARAVAP